MNLRNKMIAACKLRSRFLFGEPPMRLFLLNIRTTGQGLEIAHLACITYTQEHREHTQNTFHPITPKILKQEY